MPALCGRLAGRDLALPGLEDLAHEHIVHLVRGNTGPHERLGDGEATQIHGREASECARELADRGTGPSNNDGLSHVQNLRILPVKLPVGNYILRANYRRCP